VARARSGIGPSDPTAGRGPPQNRTSPFRLFPRKQEALPASRETLYCSALLSSDPGRTSAPDLSDASVLPTFFLPRRLHRYNPFRGSITRLCSSLPTLEGAISDASQGSLPAAGQALPGGLVPAGFQLRLSFAHSLSLSFRCWLERHPVSSGFGWRQGNWILRGLGRVWVVASLVRSVHVCRDEEAATSVTSCYAHAAARPGRAIGDRVSPCSGALR